SAARYDGASRLYAPLEFPAVADHAVVTATIEAARSLGVTHHVGTAFTTDVFYTPQEGVAFGGYHQSWAREIYEDARRQNALAAEMESSVLLVLSRVWGVRGGAMAVGSEDGFEWGARAGSLGAGT